jgi:hypothetical protein
MKKLLFIILILFAGNVTASSLPDCPSDQSERYHNCFGTYTWAEGTKYVGELKDGKQHGQGTGTFANGNTYIGEHKDGKQHGQGTYIYANGNKYIGEYKDGKLKGQGTAIFTNGAEYIGEWKDGKYNGQGTITFPDGTEERGYFMNNEFVPIICENMGLTKGTESFGQCVVELIKQIREDD